MIPIWYIISFNRSTNAIVFNYIYEWSIPKESRHGIYVMITNSLSENKHIESIISKASRMSGLVKRTLG